MALNSKALQTLMIGQFASKGITGTKIPDFSAALSEGIVEGFLAQNSVTTIDVGILPLGIPGIGTGKMIGLIPSAMLAAALPLVASEAILGAKSKDLVEAAVTAIVIHFTAANIASTNHPLVAIGSGIGKVTGLSGPGLTSFVMPKMLSKDIKGEKLQGLVKGICTGFALNVMATAIVNVVIVGVPLLILGVPVPSGGPGIGNIN